MGYGVIEEKSVGRYYPGISENVELPDGFSYELSKEGGQMTLAAHFINSYGGKWRCLIFPLDEARIKENNQKNPRKYTYSNVTKGIKEGDLISDQQAVDDEYKKFNYMISSILHIFLTPEEAAMGNVKSYEEYCLKVIEKLKGRTKGIKFRMKATLNNKHFLQLPRKANKNRPFIEPMSIPLENTKLRIFEDEVVKYPVPDKEVSVNTEKPLITDDMPF